MGHVEGNGGNRVEVHLHDILSDFEGFSTLANLADQLKEIVFDQIVVNMSQVEWFDANMCAPFGSILYQAGWANSVSVCGLRPKVEDILSKNGFLLSYGGIPKLDSYGTTIGYRRFEPKDDRAFVEYTNTSLTGKGIPEMSQGLRKKFLEGILELFNNSVDHSGTELGIYSCGQFFPKKNRLDYSLADLGMGIPENLRRMIRLDKVDEEAIDWAMTGHNTTKSGAIPGGLGLKLLRKFITLNEGRIQIVSGCGYWELKAGSLNLRHFQHPFPGTVVNIEFNTADTKSYRLSREISPEDIF
jgi:hypothetical protein